MPKKTKVLSDKYKSTTKIYPKVIMDSLTPEVKVYIEGAGDTNQWAGFFSVYDTASGSTLSKEIHGDNLTITDYVVAL